MTKHELWDALYGLATGNNNDTHTKEYSHDQALVEVVRSPMQILALGILELMEPEAWIEKGG